MSPVRMESHAGLQNTADCVVCILAPPCRISKVDCGYMCTWCNLHALCSGDMRYALPSAAVAGWLHANHALQARLSLAVGPHKELTAAPRSASPIVQSSQHC
jgi:hypothetical protein